jgi:hypothetical protein
LGHGPLAAEASRAALEIMAKRDSESITSGLTDIHHALRSTRGAAVAIAQINAHSGIVRYCGVGNVVGAIVSRGVCRRMVSHNGTAGLGTPRFTEFTYPWSSDAVLLMHSDGLATRWDLAAYPGLAQRHPALIAGVMFRDFARERDDATVVVVRESPP